MINFLSHKLKPKVNSDAVDDDFHPVSNLISGDHRALDAGFMAYSVTKPPVEIVFHLHCPIVVHRIRMWLQMGTLKTTAVEIFIQNKRGSFEKVGYGESETAEMFEFVNPRKVEPSSEVADSRKVQFVLFPNTAYLLTNCSVLKLVIRKTARCAPVLRKIECWGEPARNCPKSLKDSIESMWHEKLPQGESSPDTSTLESTVERLTDVPEEFLDELTCDIMTIPMILPSGKVVDQLTIDRHQQQEEKWGRQPSDPFTGLIFTDSRKPIFNAALKSRIDQFLIKHSDSTKYQQVPRTVGSNIRSFPLSTKYSSHNHPPSKKRKLDTDPSSEDLNLACPSLEAAVRKALSTTTRYTLTSAAAAAVDRDLLTDACHSCMKSLGSFYKIASCNHLICRDCLDVQVQSPATCSCSCGVKFEKKAVEKHHAR